MSKLTGYAIDASMAIGLGAVVAAGGHELLTLAHQPTAEVNQEVMHCAKTLGSTAVQASDLPNACANLPKDFNNVAAGCS